MFINIIFKHNLSNHPPGIEINYYALLVEVLLPLSPSCSRMISFCPVNLSIADFILSISAFKSAI